MRRVFGAVVAMVAMAMAMPVSAQAPEPAMPSGPIINSWYLGAHTGPAVVEKFGASFGLEGGIRLWRNLDAIGAMVWAQDVVTRRQLDRIGDLARHISQTQGSAASGTMEVPALYGGIGARWVFEETGRFRPYVLATVGGAKTELKPTLTLNGANITDSAAQYGITLGQDVIGKYNKLASEGGAGILLGIGTFYVDAGVRLMNITSNDQRTNVARLVLGGGYRF